VWGWFRPPAVPAGLILRVPDEAYRNQPQLAASWSLRRLLEAVGLDVARVATWQVFNVVYQGMNGTNPLLDAGLPYPLPGADPSIVIVLAAPVAAAPAVPVAPRAGGRIAQPRPTGAPVDAAANEAFERIEADWQIAMEIEKDLGRLRKQLLDMMARLKALNRDLQPQERLHSTSQDKKDWTDARRHLRDASTRLWKHIKAHDIGDTSAAGQRKWFEETFEQFIKPRIPFEGLPQAQRSYETYRKMIQTLSVDMTTALSIAQLEGERRAQQILNRIAIKVRESTQRKNILGVLLD
jgi:hypothetical protein